MELARSDHLMARASRRLASELVMLGDLETRLLGRRLEGVRITGPVFIAGLARSGTTILLDLLARLEGVATHRYRDFPFVFTPSWWNRYQDLFARTAPPRERPHGDRILITRESPEAFEEPIWQHFFSFVHDPGSVHLLDSTTSNPEFEHFFKEHIQKILMIREGRRYLSKGNYNIARLGYLARLFPDARFIVPVRHPLSHVRSLMTQHRRFVDYAASDPRIPAYLEAAGHYEFGPQRVPIRLEAAAGDRILEAWRAGEEARGYARQWTMIYRHAREQAEGPLADRVRIVRFEDLGRDPAAALAALLDFAGLEDKTGALASAAGEIRPPPPPPPAEDDEAIRAETAEVARLFGYDETPPW